MKGYFGDDGMLIGQQFGDRMPLREEVDLFDLIGISYIEPEKRIFIEQK